MTANSEQEMKFSTSQKHAEDHDTSKRTLERWRDNGIGPPYIKVGRKILYWPVGSEPYNEWARERTVFSTAEAEARSS